MRTTVEVIVEVDIDKPPSVAWDGPPLRWPRGAARPRGSFGVAPAGEGRARLITRYRPELTGTQVLAPSLMRWLRRGRLADSQALKTLLEAEAPI